MYVLGIGGLGYKDSSAAILNEGRVVAAASEERFTGIKHQGNVYLVSTGHVADPNKCWGEL